MFNSTEQRSDVILISVLVREKQSMGIKIAGSKNFPLLVLFDFSLSYSRPAVVSQLVTAAGQNWNCPVQGYKFGCGYLLKMKRAMHLPVDVMPSG